MYFSSGLLERNYIGTRVNYSTSGRTDCIDRNDSVDGLSRLRKAGEVHGDNPILSTLRIFRSRSVTPRIDYASLKRQACERGRSLSRYFSASDCVTRD